MKKIIEDKLKLSNLKYWNAFAIASNRNPSNFKRMLFSNIDKINGWLKEIGLELCVKDIKSKHIVCKCEDDWMIPVRINIVKCKKCGKEY